MLFPINFGPVVQTIDVKRDRQNGRWFVYRQYPPRLHDTMEFKLCDNIALKVEIVQLLLVHCLIDSRNRANSAWNASSPTALKSYVNGKYF